MVSFGYFMPTRICFGPGKIEELATTPCLPGKKALIVIGASGAIRRSGYLDRVMGLLSSRGISAAVFDKIQPNPLAEHVDEAAKRARSEGCDFVIGLGGGSPVDSAKSIAVMARNPGRYWDYMPSLISEAGLADETLSGYGVERGDIPAMAQNAMSAMGGLFAVTPVVQEQPDVIRIFERAYR